MLYRSLSSKIRSVWVTLRAWRFLLTDAQHLELLCGHLIIFMFVTATIMPVDGVCAAIIILYSGTVVLGFYYSDCPFILDRSTAKVTPGWVAVTGGGRFGGYFTGNRTFSMTFWILRKLLVPCFDTP